MKRMPLTEEAPPSDVGEYTSWQTRCIWDHGVRAHFLAVVVILVESNSSAHSHSPVHRCSIGRPCTFVRGSEVLLQLLLCLCPYSILGLKRHAFALHNEKAVSDQRPSRSAAMLIDCDVASAIIFGRLILHNVSIPLMRGSIREVSYIRRI